MNLTEVFGPIPENRKPIFFPSKSEGKFRIKGSFGLFGNVFIDISEETAESARNLFYEQSLEIQNTMLHLGEDADIQRHFRTECDKVFDFLNEYR